MCVYKPDLCIHSLTFSMQVQVSSETKDIGIVWITYHNLHCISAVL